MRSEMVLLPFVVGMFVWTFVEYALHHWVGHLGRGRNDFSREHLRHHSQSGYFTPTSKKVKAALPVLFTLGVIGVISVGLGIGLPFTFGFALAYTLYEILHRICHTHAPKTAYGRWARKHHFYHHFGNPKYNHGVTTPLWDIVFKTYKKSDSIAVPQTHTMPWLCSLETGAIRPEFALDYRIQHSQRTQR